MVVRSIVKHWRSFIVAALAAFMLGFMLIRLTLLDEAFLKNKLSAAISSSIQRDNTETGSINVAWWPSTVAIRDVRIKERYDWRERQNEFIQLPMSHIQIEPWKILRSRFKQAGHLQARLGAPQIWLRRSAADGQLNMQDILDTHLTRLEMLPQNCSIDLTIESGTVHQADEKNGDKIWSDINGLITLARVSGKVVLAYQLTGTSPDGKPAKWSSQ